MKTISQSPTDPGFVQNPYPFYESARGIGEIVQWSDYGIPVAMSHRAVNAILRDRRFGRARPEASKKPVPPHLEPFERLEADSMLDAEPPRHTRLRRSVSGAFTSSRIQSLATGVAILVDEFANDLPSGDFDIIGTFATLVPVRIIARLLGVPYEMAPQLLSWSHDMVAMYQARRDEDVERSAGKAAEEFAAFVREVLSQRRASPGDDLVSALLSEEASGNLSEDEIVSTVILMLNAGHEATVHTFGNALRLYLLGRIPESALAPTAIADTINEILRYDPPLHLFRRYAYEDVDLFGHKIARGAEVGVCLGAANRDPKVFAAPAVFDPTRPESRHLSFGAGIHFCVGAPLARLELQVGLPLLIARMPTLQLVEEPKYANLYHFRGLERLMVRCR